MGIVSESGSTLEPDPGNPGYFLFTFIKGVSDGWFKSIRKWYQ